jgi:polar amino acid transport system permease protein
MLLLAPDPTHDILVRCDGSFWCWDVFFRFVFDPRLINGVEFTIWLAVLAQALGVGLGLISALLKISKFPLLSVPANLYLWVFRGTPLLVQLIFFFNVLPIAFHVYWSVPLTAAVALSLNEGAYMSEIIRAGIESVETGQMEAAKALGMTYLQAMRRVILPQAARVVVPPLGNEFNNMLKTTSLVAIISGEELFFRSEEMSSQYFRPFEIYAIVALYYLTLTTVWTFIQIWIESRLGVSRGTGGGASRRRWLPWPSGRRVLGLQPLGDAR